MPPKAGASSPSAATGVDDHLSVICVLSNPDGNPCRKKCYGEKRFRSMQEHIRRAHDDHYIAKLPATAESIELMFKSPSQPKPKTSPYEQSPAQIKPRLQDGHGSRQSASASELMPAPQIQGSSSSGQYDRSTPYNHATYPRSSGRDESHPANNETAALALAQLHTQRAGYPPAPSSLPDFDRRPGTASSGYDLPPIKSSLDRDRESLNILPPLQSSASSPPRSTTLPPIQRRPRTKSITENATRPRHVHRLSKDHNKHLSALDNRRAASIDPPQTSGSNKRWLELVDAANSAGEQDSDREHTPMPQRSPHRASVPPHAMLNVQHEAFKASPLHRTLTPPGEPSGPPLHFPLPSIENVSLSHPHSHHRDLWQHAHSNNYASPSSSYQPSGPTSQPSQPLLPSLSQRSFGGMESGHSSIVRIGCARCGRSSVLRDSYACTNCIRGFCNDCLYTIEARARLGEGCPGCSSHPPVLKQFQLDIR